MNNVVFDEVLLDPEYSALAQGGPEFPVSLFRSPFSGLTQRNIDRDTGIGKYTINYAEMDDTQRAGLLNFFRAGRGPGYPFRFLDSDDNTVVGEVFGTGDGFTQHFLLQVSYTRGSRQEVRRICKPAAGNLAFVASPYGDNTITIYIDGVAVSAANVFIDSTTGIVFFKTAPGNGTVLSWDGEFHIPAYFSNQWYNPNLDTGGISEWSGIEIQECLPSELGLEDPIGLVTWTSKVNVTQSAQGNKLTKSAATSAYDAGASSVETIPDGTDGYIEAAVIETNLTRAFGLTSDPAGVTRDAIDYCIELRSDGNIYLFENGVAFGGSRGAYAAQTRYRVQVENDVVTYIKIVGLVKTVLATSAVTPPTYPLFADTAFFHQNSTLASVVIGTQG